MTRYQNTSRDSGVVAYQIEADRILVQFASGDIYAYTYKKPGKVMVEQMKELARQGRGLSTFISKAVRGRYERKLY
ncbi:hypothetical protein ABDD95_05510 [Mucilaginibacter sp. PAMB04274]|uniref:hypothetical protein n=1 Tax=Mucilaginibacter sp. PAMB04274 TaxID=3138568 RepID=UPI0031F6725B